MTRPSSDLPHLAALLAPVVIVAGLLAGGPWAGLGILLVLGLYPLADLALGDAAPVRDPARPAGALAVALPWLHGTAQIAVLAALARLAVAEGPGPGLALGAISAGLHGGCSAIVLAHELGHRRPGSAGWLLGRALLYSVHYAHFTTEHNHGHHRLVATDRDPASARAGEGLWAFVARTVPAQYRSAAAVHAARGRRWLGNPVHRGLVLQLVLLVLVALVPVHGPALAGGWLLASVVAVLLLEYVNFLQHWGLRRDPRERQTPAHSWQSTARWTRWTLLELPLHPDHHLRAARPFHELEARDGAPTLPAGYYACFWPAMVPAVWRRWLTPRLTPSGQGGEP